MQKFSVVCNRPDWQNLNRGSPSIPRYPDPSAKAKEVLLIFLSVSAEMRRFEGCNRSCHAASTSGLAGPLKGFVLVRAVWKVLRSYCTALLAGAARIGC